jgi:hypothetical protein
MHPRERNVLATGLAVVPPAIAAADIRMGTGEPHLLDMVAVRQSLDLRPMPQGGLEGRAVLVDGHGVEAVLHDGGQLGVVELEPAPVRREEKAAWNAEGAHRIEYGQRFDPQAIDVVEERLEGTPIAASAVARTGAIIAPGFLLALRRAVLGLQQARSEEIADDAAGRVGAAREPDEMDLVARPVMLAEEAIGLPDLVVQPHAGQAARHPVPHTRSHAGIVRDDVFDLALIGLHTAALDRGVGWRAFLGLASVDPDLQGLAQPDDIRQGILGVVVAPRPVEKQHDAAGDGIRHGRKARSSPKPSRDANSGGVRPRPNA